MQIAEVIGTVVSTQKNRKLEGAKLLLVQPLTLEGTHRGTALLAIDAVGAGVGERVLVSGTAPIWPDGSCDPDPEAQARRCLEIIVAALAEAVRQPERATQLLAVATALGEDVGYVMAGPERARAL